MTTKPTYSRDLDSFERNVSKKIDEMTLNTSLKLDTRLNKIMRQLRILQLLMMTIILVLVIAIFL